MKEFFALFNLGSNNISSIGNLHKAQATACNLNHGYLNVKDGYFFLGKFKAQNKEVASIFRESSKELHSFCLFKRWIDKNQHYYANHESFIQEQIARHIFFGFYSEKNLFSNYLAIKTSKDKDYDTFFHPYNGDNLIKKSPVISIGKSPSGKNSYISSNLYAFRLKLNETLKNNGCVKLLNEKDEEKYLDKDLAFIKLHEEEMRNLTHKSYYSGQKPLFWNRIHTSIAEIMYYNKKMGKISEEEYLEFNKILEEYIQMLNIELKDYGMGNISIEDVYLPEI